jgi:broad specificity phosphatase PhoE
VIRQLLLLRHGEVASHRGDVPVTDAGLEAAIETGRRLGAHADGVIRVISGETRRTRDTAAAVAQGARERGAQVTEDGVAFALRNPDLYLAGVRVDMVSTADAFAIQIPDFRAESVARVAFFREWLEVDDRVGWWVAHDHPPGDAAGDVAARIRAFAASLVDRDDPGALTVGITHSPVLRACLVDATGSDPGEPAWLAGLRVEISPDRLVRFRPLPDAP